MSRVYWDSMIFVYLIEGHSDYGPRVRAIYEEMTRRGDRLCTSVFSLGEVLTGPRKIGAEDLVERIRSFFLEGDAVDLIPFTISTADRFSIIRARSSVKSADAIHLACAAESGVELFITHDKSLQKLKIPGIHFITGLDASLF
jgi:uncharacterized protein